MWRHDFFSMEHLSIIFTLKHWRKVLLKELIIQNKCWLNVTRILSVFQTWKEKLHGGWCSSQKAFYESFEVKMTSEVSALLPERPDRDWVTIAGSCHSNLLRNRLNWGISWCHYLFFIIHEDWFQMLLRKLIYYIHLQITEDVLDSTYKCKSFNLVSPLLFDYWLWYVSWLWW